jgi:thiamine biosynthesis lipoprotein
MGFHDPRSDLSRLNRGAAGNWLRVDPSTFEVLRFALALSAASEGTFDVSVAPRLVQAGFLPSPDELRGADACADWREIEIDADRCGVRFHKPMWIDLGGVAKGYAVDRAIEAMRRAGCDAGCVNAGGDLRVFGDMEEAVLLRQPEASGEAPVVLLRDGSLASSARTNGVHINGRTRADAASCDFASVVAPCCVAADALTKVVLALGDEAGPVLRRYEARAFLRDQRGWRRLGETP